jgi:hypothetical protein
MALPAAIPDESDLALLGIAVGKRRTLSGNARSKSNEQRRHGQTDKTHEASP